MPAVYDGFVSRYLNRRISRPVSRLLAHTPVTPNQVSFISLAVAFASCAAFVYGHNIPGALLAQLSSIVDGIDGDLARAKNVTSSFGGYMDSVLDRYADALIILGVAIWASAQHDNIYVFPVAFLALSGSIIISYTRSQVRNVSPNIFDRGILSIASRDVRLFLVMVICLLGQGLATLVIIACLTNIVVALRVARMNSVLNKG